MASSTGGRFRAQLSAWRADREQGGVRHATVHSVRRLLDLGPVTAGRVDQMTGQIDQLSAAVAHDLQVSTARHEAAQRVVDAVSTSSLFEQVWSTTRWIEAASVAEDVLVSIIMPTRGQRPEGLARAVESAVGQAYGRWELIVAVDGADETVDRVTEILPTDERLRVVRSSNDGVSAARNAGLAAARGDLITYLDDDNLMGPLWLKAVVWSTGAHPGADVFFGAQLVEDGTERMLPTGPALALAPFDRRRLRRDNYIDQGAVAHRRDLPEAHYDESLTSSVDWDLLLRLTATREPVMIPVVSGSYFTSAPDRLTDAPESTRGWEIVNARARSMASLRILAVNAMYPLITETYIGEDLDVLASEGADIACCVLGKRTAPSASPYPLYHDLGQAIDEHEPDLVLLHWAGFGLSRRAQLQELGVPYAVRGHSFANEPECIQELVTDPQCIGVWCFPHHATEHPRVHPLPVAFAGHARLPAPQAKRDLVLSTSAGLPKKDFPLLIEAFGMLPGIDRRIVVGTTAEHESVVTDLVLRAQELEDPPLVQANLTRSQVFELLARTSVAVYTLRPDAGFGIPMSVVEAMTAGACVVLPDRPEVLEVFGPDVRTYASAEDIARHVREVLAGGPHIEAERERLQERALEQFCDPEIGKRFYAELVEALEAATPVG